MAPKPSARRTTRSGHVLSIDIGGTGLKAGIVDLGGRLLGERQRIATPSPCTPSILVDSIGELVVPLGGYKRIAAGFPGVVRDGRIVTAPHFHGDRWAGFDLAKALSEKFAGPCLVANDAEVQGLAAITGKGLELMLTLGTGAGTGLFRDGEIMPHMELAQHPVHKKKTYNDYVGDKELKKVGKKKWNEHVEHVIGILHTLLNYDHLFIGGGNSRHVELDLPRSVTLVTNDAGIEGGGILWRRALS